ncbi:MarR family winged helix-turn-helix transcriptional regulator [Thermopolyspora sp. NPDC052614]|uniref:MarR family winged helix-turn-helix transcriptional regulator n=1 Tax=Thermopolyspora sp. NPDC052614 TaxID=3155682 RepID=UPI00343EC8F7
MSNATANGLPPGLESDFGWLLGQLFHAHVSAVKDIVADVPGGHRGYLALSAAAHQTARNQIEMSRQLGCDRTVMVYLIDDLVKQGLVERRPDPLDRRNRLIVATDKGLERLAEVNQAIAGMERRLLSALEPAEQEALRDMMKRVVAHCLGHDAGSGAEACVTVASALDEAPTC